MNPATGPAGAPYAEGQVLPEHSYTVTRDDLRRYAAASGDHNPVHLSDTAAEAAGFPGVIAHGMYTLALAARALEDWARGPGRIRDLRAKFTRPVVVPDEDGTVVTVGGVVRSVEPVDGELLVSVALEVSCGIDRVLGAPRATFAVPEEQP
jgi:acyl dehydratase